MSLSSLLAFPFSHQPTRPSCSSHVPGRRRRGATAVLGGGKQSPGPNPRPGKLRRARELPGEGSSSRMAPCSWAGAGRASSSRFQLKPGSTNRPSALGRVKDGNRNLSLQNHACYNGRPSTKHGQGLPSWNETLKTLKY